MPKIVNHDQRRKKIALAAIQVIAKKGLESTKLTDIAKLANVTTGAITHYFNDKDAVLIASLEATYQAMFERINLITKKEDYSLLEVLSKTLPTSNKSRVNMSVWLAFWSRSISEPSVTQIQNSYHVLWHDFVKEQLIRHLTEEPKNIDDLSEGVTAQINGLIIRSLVEPSKWTKTRQIKMLKNYLDLLPRMAE